jgi:hypothetical protein
VWQASLNSSRSRELATFKMSYAFFRFKADLSLFVRKFSKSVKEQFTDISNSSRINVTLGVVIMAPETNHCNV